MKKILLLLALLGLVISLPVLPGCALKPVAVAEGQDAVVVNAERVQTTSLATFKNLTEWELTNRALLPAEVSRGVDAVRRDFPPLWRESRKALADYQARRGPTLDGITRITAALSAAQASMLSLRAGDAEQINAFASAIARLADSIQKVRN